MKTETQTISFRIPTYQLECVKQTARNIAVEENRDYNYTDLIRDSIEQFIFGLLTDREKSSNKKFARLRIDKPMIKSWVDFKSGITIERFHGDKDSVDVLLSGDAFWKIGENGCPPNIAIGQVSKKYICDSFRK